MTYCAGDIFAHQRSRDTALCSYQNTYSYVMKADNVAQKNRRMGGKGN